MSVAEMFYTVCSYFAVFSIAVILIGAIAIEITSKRSS